MANSTSSIYFNNISLPLNKSHNACISWQYYDSFSTSDIVLITIGYAILLFFSLFGNALVIGVFYRRSEQLRSPVNYFIASMAVSDLLIPLFVIPRSIQEIYLGWGYWLVGGVLGDILCKVVHYADEVSVTVSSQSMVLIAAERFWSIVFPMKSPLISKRTAPRFVCFTWIFSLTIFLYYFFAYNLIDENNSPYCNYDLPQIFATWEDLWRIDRVSLLVLFVMVPFILMTVFYSLIIIYIRRGEKSVPHLPSETQLARAKENRKITVMLVAVMVLFFTSWTPFYIYFFIHYYFPDVNVPCGTKAKLYWSSRYVNYIYTAINPSVYYVFNTNYRQGFQELLCSSRCSCFHGYKQRSQRRVQIEPISTQRDNYTNDT